MRIGDRIKALRLKKGLTQSELAELLGYKSKSSVAHIENGRDIPRSMVVQLSEILDTTPAYLMGWDDSEKQSEYSDGGTTPSNAVPVDPTAMKPIPILGHVSAGYGLFADSECIVGYKMTDLDSLTGGYDYAWLQVEGDSMEPELYEDDLVLVRVQETAETGDFAVVLIDGDNGVVKKIEYEPQHHITLISLNPDYPPRVFVGEEMNRVRIFGLVVEMRRCLH